MTLNLSLQSSVVESADSAYLANIWFSVFRFSAYAKAEENKTREIATGTQLARVVSASWLSCERDGFSKTNH